MVCFILVCWFWLTWFSSVRRNELVLKFPESNMRKCLLTKSQRSFVLFFSCCENTSFPIWASYRGKRQKEKWSGQKGKAARKWSMVSGRAAGGRACSETKTEIWHLHNQHWAKGGGREGESREKGENMQDLSWHNRGRKCSGGGGADKTWSRNQLEVWSRLCLGDEL